MTAADATLPAPSPKVPASWSATTDVANSLAMASPACFAMASKLGFPSGVLRATRMRSLPTLTLAADTAALLCTLSSI